MATFREQLVYGTPFSVNIALAGLAFDLNLLAGVESDAIDNTIDGLIDILVSGYMTTGTGPVASRAIELWAVGSRDAANWPHVFDGVASNETITSALIKQGICKSIWQVTPNTTSNFTYHFSGISLASAFGNFLPPKTVFFGTQSTGTALDPNANQHLLRCQPIYRQIVTV